MVYNSVDAWPDLLYPGERRNVDAIDGRIGHHSGVGQSAGRRAGLGSLAERKQKRPGREFRAQVFLNRNGGRCALGVIVLWKLVTLADVLSVVFRGELDGS